MGFCGFRWFEFGLPGSSVGFNWVSTGSLLDTILHFCYNKTLIRIKNGSFLIWPRQGTSFGFRRILWDSDLTDDLYIGVRSTSMTFSCAGARDIEEEVIMGPESNGCDFRRSPQGRPYP